MPVHSNAIFLLTAIIGLCASGCTPVSLTIPLEEEYNRLVVYGLIEADSVVRIRLTRTLPATGTYAADASFLVQDATVQLYQNDTLAETLTADTNGYYYSAQGSKPLPHTRYSIRAYAPGFREIVTESVALPSFPVLSPFRIADTVLTQYPYLSDDSLRGASSILSDTTSSASGYGVIVTRTPSTCARGQETISLWNDPMRLSRSYLYLADTAMATHSGRIDCLFSMDCNGKVPTQHDTLFITIQAYSGSYFRAISIQTGPSRFIPFAEAFYESPPTFTNVINGFGIWGALASKKIPIPIN